jgi:hypothetical protein
VCCESQHLAPLGALCCCHHPEAPPACWDYDTSQEYQGAGRSTHTESSTDLYTHTHVGCTMQSLHIKDRIMQARCTFFVDCFLSSHIAPDCGNAPLQSPQQVRSAALPQPSQAHTPHHTLWQWGCEQLLDRLLGGTGLSPAPPPLTLLQHSPCPVGQHTQIHSCCPTAQSLWRELAHTATALCTPTTVQ